MSKKIETLTPEQEAKLDPYTREGIAIGMATSDGTEDKEKIKELINKHRVLCGVGEAEKFIFEDSPMAACEKYGEFGINPGNALYGSHDINWLQFYMFFRNECGLIEETKNIVHLYELAKMCGWMWFGRTTVIVTPRPSKIFTTPKKNTEALDETVHVLHNPDGMAVEYADGRGLYAIDGITLDSNHEWIVTDKAKLTAENVMKIANTDLRSAALKLLGSESIVDLLDGKVLDEDSFTSYHMPKDGKMVEVPPVKGLEQFYEENYTKVTSHYKLLELDFNGQRRVYLDMKCPSKGDRHVEAVPPHFKTVNEANIWCEEQTGSVYMPPLVRT